MFSFTHAEKADQSKHSCTIQKKKLLNYVHIEGIKTQFGLTWPTNTDKLIEFHDAGHGIHAHATSH